MVAGSNPAGAWIFVLCVLHTHKKAKMQDNQDKETSTEYERIQRKNLAGVWMFVLCLFHSKDKGQKSRTIRT